MINDLFTDTTYTQLVVGVTYDAVKGVNESVIKLTDVTLRNKLKKLIETVRELCDNKIFKIYRN
ncbi:toxin Cry1Ac domain D-VI-related protein [Enterococcus faecalis]|uniref:toxin Cry1Ac domain D-VI-related protein n=1 Tax=Enterococcus faecalis TaxID=1351 RepID=UPI003B637932